MDGGLEAPLFVEETFSFKTEKGVINLENFFLEYQLGDESTQSDIVSAVVDFLMGRDPGGNLTPEEMKQCLLPSVRARFQLGMMKLNAQIDGEEFPDIPHRNLTEHLSVHLVVDLPSVMSYVTEDTLNDLELDFEEAYQMALENLRLKSEIGFKQIEPGLFMGPWNDYYVPARLLLPELFKELEVKGELIAMPVHRNVVLVSGSEDTENHPLLIALIEEALDAPRAMSPRFLALKQGEWSSWVPENDSPCYDQLRLFSLQAEAQDANEQKEGLDQLHEQNGTDIFVASVQAIEQQETGRVSTYCVWTKTVDTLLPKADLILFADIEADGIVAQAHWDIVFDRCSHLMKPQSIYPERYRVTEFPDKSILEEINQEDLL